MRLVSYNILDGGEGRADPLAEVIGAQNPDVVVLVEADHPEVVERIAARLKMDVILAEGKKHGAAILSRWPILHSINHGLLRKEFADVVLEASIQPPAPEGLPTPGGLPGNGPITVAAVHLHPRAAEADEDRRMKEVAALLETFAKHRKTKQPHLLAGDFNANSPVQVIDPAQCKPRTRQDWESNGGHIPRRAVQAILDAGYLDTLHAARGPVAGNMASFTPQHPGQRIDYIFSFGIEPAMVRQAWIEQDRLARYASDHFPIGVELDSAVRI